jgi:predicted nucleic acid-binding protein
VIAFDTNVLVYAVDHSAGERRGQALALVSAALEREGTVILLQSLAEFFRATTRPRFGLTPAKARAFIDVWRAAAPVVPYTEADLLAATDAVAAHKLSFFDALLWATAERAGVTHFITQDQQDGRRLGRVTFLDPFAAGNRAALGLG